MATIARNGSPTASVKTVMLVEDEPIIALATSRKLESWEYIVTIARTGEESVRMVGGGYIPDLILMDIDLGAGIKGSEAATAILAMVNVPIVFLTSHSEREMVDRVRGITRYGYVIKNSGDFVLRSSIEMALELFDSHRDIENKVHALLESETLYRNLMENNKDAVYLLDLDGKVLNVNDAACSMLGYPREELLRMGIGEIDIDFPKERFMEFWSRNPMGATIVFETRHRHHDGHEVPVEVNGIFFTVSDRKYLYGVARDLTESNRTKRLLEAEQEKLRNVIRAVNAGTWEWNIQTGEAAFDQGSAALLGYSIEEMRPITMESWMGFKHPDDMQESAKFLESHIRGESDFYEYESRMRHKDGRWVWILGRGKLITRTGDGKPLWMFGTHTDITDRKKAEEELRAKNAELTLTLKEVHHRIKNNMNSLQSLLSLKEDVITDQVAIAALEDSKSRLRSLMVLYDKLYRSSDVNAMSVKDYFSTLVDEIIKNYPSRITFRIVKDIDDFELDMKRIQTLGIIINELLTNIMKYAFGASGEGIIQVSAKLSGSRVEIAVFDNGKGMPACVTLEQSTGFGLQLVNALSRQISGSARIEREGGTRIVIGFEL